ncbi:MAG TPA: hypothetical protein VFS67_23285 [Polyangiaceae bacterium]|jgi:hypothetical protein|nr:hypothetical protein [Polyangiaceae bacterium]
MTSGSPSLPGEAERRALAVLAVPGFRPFLATFFLTMMADNIEHVISYWLLFQKLGMGMGWGSARSGLRPTPEYAH